METATLRGIDEATIVRLENLAETTALQLLPALWKRLQSDGPNSSPELRGLLGQRLRDEIFDFYVCIEVIKENPKVQGADIDLFQGLDLSVVPQVEAPIVRRAYEIFARQLEQYRKKYKEEISQTILRAKEGQLRAVCRLLEWDKTWIEADFIHTEISARGRRYRPDEDDRFPGRLVCLCGKPPRRNGSRCRIQRRSRLHAPPP